MRGYNQEDAENYDEMGAYEDSFGYFPEGAGAGYELAYGQEDYAEEFYGAAEQHWGQSSGKGQGQGQMQGHGQRRRG